MKSITSTHVALLLGVAAIAIACGDGAGLVGPPAAESPAAELLAAQRWRRADRAPVPVLRRTLPLYREQSVAATIGADGGEIIVPAAGFRMRIPAGALSERTTITVTAVAGHNVAYVCAPHGLEVLRPAIVTQDLRMTSARANRAVRGTLEAAYFDDAVAAFGADEAEATVSERGPAVLAGDQRAVLFAIHHFSGYLVASGYKDPAPPVNR